MKTRASSGVVAAGVLALGVTAFAQSGAQQPAGSQAQAGARASDQQPITVTGCVQKEADYRKSQDAGRGGVAGTGVGSANEFVLTSASSSASGSSAGSGATGTTGTTGTSMSGSMTYELTGPNEGQLGQYVGRRVEITGKLKAAEVGAAGGATGGATAGAPPAGVDVASKDLKLRELEVTSVREASGSCPATK